MAIIEEFDYVPLACADAHIHAVFPAPSIDIRYLERNPAPGTEEQPPGPPPSRGCREL